VSKGLITFLVIDLVVLAFVVGAVIDSRRRPK
jgi:hypothetical protein